MTTPSPTPRRVALPRWIDARLMAGVVLVLVSVIVGARLLTTSHETAPVVAVTHDVAVGSRLGAGDLAIVRVRMPKGRLVLYAGSVAAVSGREVSRPLRAGELVPLSGVRASRPSVTLVLPLPGDAAPRLAAGQRIAVWVSTPECPARVLLADVTVQSTRADGGGSFSAGTGQQVVVGVDPLYAGRVMAALATKDVALRAGLLTQDAPPADPPPGEQPPNPNRGSACPGAA